MSCERYEEALIEAAAGSRLPAALREHVASCERCRSAYSDQQVLLAAIDTQLHQRVNAQLSAAFLPRVRASVSHQPAPTRQSIPGWIYACSAAAAMIFMVLMIQVFERRGQIENIERLTGIETSATHSDGRRATRARTLEAGNAVARRRLCRRNAQTGIAAAAMPEAEVLVPPGQEAILISFYETVRTSPQPEDAFVAEKQDLQPEPLLIQPLRVADLESTNRDEHRDVSR
jgi:hypothetical protein